MSEVQTGADKNKIETATPNPFSAVGTELAQTPETVRSSLTHLLLTPDALPKDLEKTPERLVILDAIQKLDWGRIEALLHSTKDRVLADEIKPCLSARIALLTTEEKAKIDLSKAVPLLSPLIVDWPKNREHPSLAIRALADCGQAGITALTDILNREWRREGRLERQFDPRFEIIRSLMYQALPEEAMPAIWKLQARMRTTKIYNSYTPQEIIKDCINGILSEKSAKSRLEFMATFEAPDIVFFGGMYENDTIFKIKPIQEAARKALDSLPKRLAIKQAESSKATEKCLGDSEKNAYIQDLILRHDPSGCSPYLREEGVRNPLQSIQTAVTQVQKEHPEFVGVFVIGGLGKGYWSGRDLDLMPLFKPRSSDSDRSESHAIAQQEFTQRLKQDGFEVDCRQLDNLFHPCFVGDQEGLKQLRRKELTTMSHYQGGREQWEGKRNSLLNGCWSGYFLRSDYDYAKATKFGLSREECAWIESARRLLWALPEFEAACEQYGIPMKP